MEPMKEKIAYHARRLFDIHGFHGTALRDICKLAGCKMPTIYYYYENKEKLFDEVVRVAFEELVARLWTQLPKDISHIEYNIQKVIQKKHLSEDERIIYRLAIKTWLRCDGFDECRKAYGMGTESLPKSLGGVCFYCRFSTVGKVYCTVYYGNDSANYSSGGRYSGQRNY